MFAFLNALKEETNFSQMLGAVEGGKTPVVLSGLERTHKTLAASAVRHLTGRQVVIVCSDELEAEKCAGDISFLTKEEVTLLSAREFTFFNVENASRQPEHQRIKALHSMLNGRAPILVTTADGLMQRTITKEKLLEATFELRLGLTEEMGNIALKLTLAGYKRCEQVEGAGQFSVRGGILDFFSPAYNLPIRCEFFGDEIDSMGLFDTGTQRRLENIDKALVLPVAETLPELYDGGIEGLCEELSELGIRLSKRKNTKHDLIMTLQSDVEKLKNRVSLPAVDKYMHVIYREMASAADYISPDAVVMMFEPKALSERAKNYTWQLNSDMESMITGASVEGSIAQYLRSWEETCAILAERAVVMLDSFTGSGYPIPPRTLLNMAAKQLPSYGGSLETAAGDIKYYLRSDYSAVVLCGDRRRADIMSQYLREAGINAAISFELEKLPERGSCYIGIGGLSAGVDIPSIRLAVITEGQIAEQAQHHKKLKRKTPTNRQKLDSYADLSPGDTVVHEHHGIGRFVGIFPMDVDGLRKDYVKIAYLGTDSLYVPATQLDLVSKYIGGGEDKPVKLSRLGGSDWQKTKIRAKKAAQDLAKGLIELYAERQRIEGFAFSPDSSWQTEFEESFEYDETEDQLRSIEEIKTDMEKPVPMDRLLCGDVGYGKTEVAFRAVMKCVLDGKQAAILVPTTVLAQQHYVTALKRFAGYPIRIEVLSRFRTQTQIKQALVNIKGGSADIVIGTHRLIQKDVQFKRLGLLIVDEEQRFGVSHKEKLKELSRSVDVLTLSATPIPRTLNMALSGIRDMSTIEEPPQDRHPVQTYVLEHNWGILGDAIRREVARGGQVYYLHNRIESIDRCAARISGMIEGISVAVAHGQMDEESLGRIMERMVSGEIQILVCTTIIETGIDIPNVNTLIIEDADKMGLAQLHQIRGRVGRSSRHAFAYLTFRQNKILTEIAAKRLSAIREFAEFNSGFKIAMRDLEIRGAGNLLGAEQSGHMISVGYDMYLKLLEEAVLEERGEKPETKTECSADLSVAAHIPESYIPSGEHRMDLYRRIAQVRTEEDSDDLLDEMIDRFGEPPKSVITLINVALLRGKASKAGITSIAQKSGWLYMKLSVFDMEQISALYNMERFKKRMKIEAGETPALRLKLRQGSNAIADADEFISAYAELSAKKEDGNT